MDFKISVIIPIYNMEKYLPECIESILIQTLNPIEIIAVNDGSTDGSLSILERYQRSHPFMIVLNQNNQGAGAARNNGIQHAKGKYIIFMDPDDYYPDNDCLEALYDAAERENVLVCGGAMMLDFDGVLEERKLLGRELVHSDIVIDLKDCKEIYGHQRYLFRTSMIRDNDIYFPSYRRFQDPPFTLKALICARRCLEIDKIVYGHRVGHAKINYSLKNCIDILHGIRDVYRMAAAYDLLNMYEARLKNIVIENVMPFFKYSFAGYREIDETIEEINQIAIEWIGEKAVCLTEEKVKQFREECINDYVEIGEIFSSNKQIIIYGAGVNALNLFEIFKENLKNIVGVAVSKKAYDKKNYIKGMEIREIEEFQDYRNELIVMIVTMPRYWGEIEENLERLGFRDIWKVNVKKLELAIDLVGEKL